MARSRIERWRIMDELAQLPQASRDALRAMSLPPPRGELKEAREAIPKTVRMTPSLEAALGRSDEALDQLLR
jgi:hypothetical protein